jgi:hypothetical protein
VASGLILRFDNLDCITNNTTRFADEFVDGGSIISFGEHSFYVVVPESLPDEVTLFSDPLCDEDSCCSDNFDLGAMAEVLMTGAEEGADLLCTGSPSLECIPPESAATSQPQVHDTLELAIQASARRSSPPIQPKRPRSSSRCVWPSSTKLMRSLT